MDTDNQVRPQAAPKEYTPEARAEWIRRYRDSGMGLKRFAAENGLKPRQLHYWVYGRRVRPARKMPAHEPVFQEIRLPEALRGVGWSAEIGWRDGTTVRFRADTDPRWVRSLLDALRP